MAPSLRWLALGALALTSCDGCNRTETYPFRDVPFCASDDPKVSPAWSSDFILLTKWRGGWGYQEVTSMTGRRMSLSVNDDDVVLVVLECGGPTVKPIDDKMDELDASTVPSLCPGQKVLFHDQLAADRDARSEGLGHAGFYTFPKVALSCAAGTLVTDEPHTLSEILQDFSESVRAYHDKHEGRLPPSFAALVADTHAPPLPPDPWGSALIYEQSGTKVVLKSAGPDTKPSTKDDIDAMVIDSAGGGYTTNSITVFDGTEYSMYGDYQRFIGKKAP